MIVFTAVGVGFFVLILSIYSSCEYAKGLPCWTTHIHIMPSFSCKILVLVCHWNKSCFLLIYHKSESTTLIWLWSYVVWSVFAPNFRLSLFMELYKTFHITITTFKQLLLNYFSNNVMEKVAPQSLKMGCVDSLKSKSCSCPMDLWCQGIIG